MLFWWPSLFYLISYFIYRLFLGRAEICVHRLFLVIPFYLSSSISQIFHDDIIKWKHFLRHWPFVRGIHRSPVNSPHKGQWCWALMFSLICTWKRGWVNNWDARNLRRYHAHYDITVMCDFFFTFPLFYLFIFLTLLGKMYHKYPSVQGWILLAGLLGNDKMLQTHPSVLANVSSNVTYM